MDNLEKYAEIFDESYPDYAEVRYKEIISLVKAYDSPGALKLIRGEEFKKISSLIRPVVAIKNYKSQIPFPEDLATVIHCLIEIREIKPELGNILNAHKSQFEQLLKLQGFQLPTVSAIFHFCHPDHFPIVDVNVESACILLKESYPSDFEGFETPSLPAANTSTRNKEKKYLEFIKFIDKVINLQGGDGYMASYRDIDKALMVFGVPRLRNKIDLSSSRL